MYILTLFNSFRQSSNSLRRLNHTFQFRQLPRCGAGSKNYKETFGPGLTLISMLCKYIHSRLQLDLDSLFSYLQTPSPTRPLPPHTIHSACLVADVLGPEVRGHMIDRYVAFEFKEYRRIFRPTDEAGQLDNVGRRFAWFRRVLGRHETEMENDPESRRVFPEDWKVGWALFSKFSEITRYVPISSTTLYLKPITARIYPSFYQKLALL